MLLHSSLIRFLPVLTLLAALPACKNLQPIIDGAQLVAQAQGRPSNSETGNAIKQALKQGVNVAVKQLGKEDAFYRTSAKILLPKELQSVGEKARQFGLGRYVDDFELSMNRAAEKAVPKALDILVTSVSRMTLQDVIGIMQGGNDAATQYFKRTTKAEIGRQFLPIVRQKTQATGVTRNYKKLASKVNTFGRLAGVSLPVEQDLDGFITQQAVTALFNKIAEKEKAIRSNPRASGSALIKKVFSYYQ